MAKKYSEMRRALIHVVVGVVIASAILGLSQLLFVKKSDRRFLKISSATWTYKDNGKDVSRPIDLGIGLPSANHDLVDCCHGIYRFTVDSSNIQKLRQSEASEDGEQSALFIPAIGGNFSIRINGHAYPYSSFEPSIVGPLVPISIKDIGLMRDLNIEVSINGPVNGFAGIWRGPVLVGGFGDLDQQRQKDLLLLVVIPVFFAAITGILVLVFGYFYLFTGRQFPHYGLFALGLIPIMFFQIILSGLPRKIDLWFGAIAHYPASLLESLGVFLLLTCFLAHLNGDTGLQRVKRQVSFRLIVTIFVVGAIAIFFCFAAGVWIGPNVAAAILHPLAFYPILFWPLLRMPLLSENFLGFVIGATGAIGSFLDGAKITARVFSISLPYEYSDRLTMPLVMGSTVLVFVTHFRRFYRAHQHSVAAAARDSAIVRTVQMVAHDVKRPFSLLKNALLIIKKETFSDKTQEHLSFAELQIDQALRAVNDMIDDMMSLGGEPATSREATDPQVLVSEALSMMSVREIDKTIRVTRDHSHQLYALADRSKVVRVLTNIIENAIDATPKGGWVHIATKDDGKTQAVLFIVANSGSFISTDDRRQIFDAFFTKGKERGTGLGLAIAKKIVEAHDGNIECDSSLQSGTEFRIRLPAATPTTAAESENDAALVDKTDLDLQATECTVAIVEDDPFLLEISEERFAPFKVRTFASPTAFLQEFKRGKLDDIVCVVTDFVFDNVGGYENGLTLATEIKSRKPDLPIFLCSDFALSASETSVFAGRLSKADLPGQELKIILQSKLKKVRHRPSQEQC